MWLPVRNDQFEVCIIIIFTFFYDFARISTDFNLHISDVRFERLVRSRPDG